MVSFCCLYRRIPHSRPKPIPLTNVKIGARVVDLIAEVHLIHEYNNNESIPIECEFMFPIQEQSNVSVFGFEADVAGRKIMGVSKEKQQAKQEFVNAVHNNQEAFLLETEGKQENCFKITIGNFPPHSSCSVKLSYFTELKQIDGVTTFTLPQTLTPTGTNYGNGLTGGLSVDIIAEMATPILSLESESHPLAVEVNGNRARVALAQGQKALNTDFVLKIKQLPKAQETMLPNANPYGIRAWLEKDPESGRSQAAMVVLSPDNLFLGCKPAKPIEAIFLIDRSGSMRRESRMERAKDALLLFLRGLPEGSLFNIVSFGTSHSFLWNQSEQYNDYTLDEATRHVHSMSANMMETNIIRPLQEIFRLPYKETHSRQVFILTDGAVNSPDQVVSLVQANANKNRVFTVGIGDGVSYYLVRDVARVGRGTSEFVKGNQRIESKVMTQLKLATRPALNNITINWANKSGDDLIVPRHEPSVFLGSNLTAYCLLNSNAECPMKEGDIITINATRGEECENITLTATISATTMGKLVQLLAANAIIKNLESLTSDKKEDWAYLGNQREIQNSVVELATKYGLLSQFTSFVAVDKDSFVPFAYHTREISTANSQTGSTQNFGIKPVYRGVSKSAMAPMMPMNFSAPQMAQQQSYQQSFSRGFSGPVSRKLEEKEWCRDESLSRSRRCSSERKEMEMLKSSVSTKKKKQSSPRSYDRGGLDMCNSIASTSDVMDCMVVAQEELEEDCDSAVLSPRFSGDDLSKLAQLQSARGTWELDTNLAAILKQSLNILTGKCPTTPDVSDKTRVWATCLAVAFLRAKLADYKDDWEMLELKACAWLEKQLPDSLSSWISQATQALQ